EPDERRTADRLEYVFVACHLALLTAFAARKARPRAWQCPWERAWFFRWAVVVRAGGRDLQFADWRSSRSSSSEISRSLAAASVSTCRRRARRARCSPISR